MFKIMKNERGFISRKPKKKLTQTLTHYISPDLELTLDLLNFLKG